MPNRVLEHLPLIHWHARRFARQFPFLDAEDVAQDAVLTALRRFHGFDPTRGPIQTWLSMLVRAAALGAARSRRRGSAVQDCGQLAGATDPRTSDPSRFCDLPAALAAVEHLPAPQRAAVEARFGLNGRAERQRKELDPGVRASTNSMRVTAGLRRVRKELGAAACPRASTLP